MFFSIHNDNIIALLCQAVLKEGERDGASSIELVSCTLTLFYDYWSMNEVIIPTPLQVPVFASSKAI